MKARVVLAVCAAAGVVLGIIAVITSHLNPPPPAIPYPPPLPPFTHFISTVGMTLCTPDNIALGSPFSEIVEKVYVESGSSVKKGDPLFKLNTLRLKAELLEAEAACQVVEAKYQRMLDLPRDEEIPIQHSRFKKMEAKCLDVQAQFALYECIVNPKAVSKDAFNQRKYAALAAQHALEEEKQELELFLKGAWIRDLEIIRAQLKLAEAKIKRINLDIERSTIRAPFSGVALKVNVNPGEYVESSRDINPPLVLFGAMTPMDIIVDVDEEDVWRVMEGAEGVAYVRGNSSLSTPLHFLYIAPYLVPKSSFAGADIERSDTRVLQIRYRIEPSDFPLYAGQMMDVIIEARPNEGDGR